MVLCFPKYVLCSSLLTLYGTSNLTTEMIILYIFLSLNFLWCLIAHLNVFVVIFWPEQGFICYSVLLKSVSGSPQL